MRIIQLTLLSLFLGVMNEAYALCVDGTIGSCTIGGKPGIRECVGGQFGPCEEEEPPTPPPTPMGCILNSATTPPTNCILNSATTPISTRVQIEEWQRVVNDQLGVAGRDPIGHRIGSNAAKRGLILGKNWYPIDIYKQTLVGTLHHFNFYDGSGDEADWNNFIIPTTPFAYILKDVLPIADSDDVRDCISKDDCAEAEITPDDLFYENPYFTRSTDKSALEGGLIGTYGPWVWEEAHGTDNPTMIENRDAYRTC